MIRLLDLLTGIPTCVGIIWLVRRNLGPHSWPLRGHWSLLILLLWTLASCTWSAAPRYSLEGAFRLAAMMAFAYHLARSHSPREILGLVSAALAIMLLLSYAMIIFHPSRGLMIIENRPSAWKGVFPDKNALGFIAAVSILCGASGVFDTRLRRWSASLVFLALPALWGCRSAGALTVTGVAFLAWVSAAVFHRLRSRGHRAAWGAALIFVLAFMGSSQGSHLVIRLLNRDLSLTTRSEIWVRVVARIEQRPWLGHGYQAFWPASLGTIREQLKFTPEDSLPEGYPGHSHNGILETAADLGMVGVLLLGFAVLWAVGGTIRFTRHGGLSHWPMTLAFAVIINNLTETSFLQVRGAGGVGWALFLLAASMAWSPGPADSMASPDLET